MSQSNFEHVYDGPPDEVVPSDYEDQWVDEWDFYTAPVEEIKASPVQYSAKSVAKIRMPESESESESESEVKPEPEDLHSIERAFLGCMLQNQNTAAIGLKFLNPEQFTNNKTRIIAEAIQEIVDTGGAVQTHTIVEYLRNRKTASGVRYIEIVDAEEVHTMALSAPKDPAFETYAKAIEDRWQRGQLESLTANVHAGLTSGIIKTATDAKRALEKKLIELTGKQISSQVTDIFDSYLSVIENVAYDIEHQGEIVGVATGFDGLDGLTGGLRPGQLIVVAGTSGSGKTSLAMNMTSHMVLEGNQPVVFFSLEMSNKELAQRVISSSAEIPYERIRDRKLSETDWGQLAELRRVFKGAPLKIVDQSDVGFLDIKSYAYEMMGEYDVPPVIVVDYLQLMNLDSGNKYSSSKADAVGDVTRGLKILANELQTTIIILSQLTKESERRDNKRPRLSDLRDSGAIAQDADMVVFTYRDDSFYQHSGDQSIAEIIIGKHRAGAKGTLYLGFMKQFTKFVNLPNSKDFIDGAIAPAHQRPAVDDNEVYDMF